MNQILDMLSQTPAGLYLGLDIGTSHAAAVLYSWPEKKTLASASLTLESLPASQPGESCQDPLHILKQVKQLYEKFSSQPLQAIGLSGQMHGIVYLDEHFQALSPLYNWLDQRQSPTRVPEALASLAQGYGVRSHWLNGALGCRPSGYRWVSDIATFIGLQLCKDSQIHLSPSMLASFGLYNNGDLNRSLLADLQLNHFPPVAELQFLGCNSQHTPISVALGDHAASVLAQLYTDNLKFDAENVLLLNLGTSGQLCCIQKEKTQHPPPAGIELRPLMADRQIYVGAALAGGKAYQLLAYFIADVLRIFNDKEPSFNEIYQLLNSLESKDTQLQFTPYFFGQRQQDTQKAAIQGLTADNFNISSFKNSLLKGIIEELFTFYTSICSFEERQDKVIIAAGNAFHRIPQLQRICSEKFVLPVKLTSLQEQSAIGAALYSMCSLVKKNCQVENP